MSLPFIVETGAGDPDATSYADQNYAGDYIGTNSYAAAAWAALDDDSQQNLLVRSTKTIDNYVTWNGKRVDPDSGLRWPRTGVYDSDGFEFPCDEIPQILQDAVCELASYLMSDDWTAPQSTRGMKEIKVDVLEIVYDPQMTRPSLPDYVIQMLSELGSVNRGNRPSFKKLNRV